MREFIHELCERSYQNRKIGIIENGSWAPTAAKVIKKMLESSKNITFTDTVVSIRSAMSEQNRAEIRELANEILN